MLDKINLVLIGPLPPPSGGVSVHINRLSKILKEDYNIDYIDESATIKQEYYNIRSLSIFGYIKKIIWADLLHIHSGSNILRIFHLLSGSLFSKKIILTLHSYPAKKQFFPRSVDEITYRLADKIIIVNSNILDRISIPANKCITQNAFLPPILEEEPTLPLNIKKIIGDCRVTNNVVICANAWQLDVFNNTDLYGLDMCIVVTKKLIDKGLNIRFIFNVATIEKSNKNYLKYDQLIQDLNLQDIFHLMNEKISFVRLMEKADIILRPTNTDGDALTVREALFLGKPILASDIVQRPLGTVTFKSRDIKDLETKLEALINSNVYTSLNQSRDKEYETFYKGLYNELLEVK